MKRGREWPILKKNTIDPILQAGQGQGDDASRHAAVLQPSPVRLQRRRDPPHLRHPVRQQPRSPSHRKPCSGQQPFSCN